MDIEVVWGSAEGATELGAFDRALGAAGIADYNLVGLSSVVPPDATVVEAGTHGGDYGVGAVVTAVLAEATRSEPGTVAAGLGWLQATEGGVFYEASADSRAACRQELQAGLADARDLREWDWAGDPQYRIVEYPVERAGAAVVAAVYGPLDDPP